MDFCVISDQIERSQTFTSKGQLRKLLGVLSKNMDSQVALSPELVIKELWPDEIRTKRSADVATEMNRLRHALKSYYDGEGASDPITISLPNRAAGTVNGSHERPWMVATPRGGEEESGAEEGVAGERPPDSQGNRLQANHRAG